MFAICINHLPRRKNHSYRITITIVCITLALSILRSNYAILLDGYKLRGKIKQIKTFVIFLITW